MNKTIQRIMQNHLADNKEALLQASKNAENYEEARGATLGEGCRMRFLAATGFTSVNEALDSADVVHVSKRAMLVDIGGLLHCFGRFGVPFFLVPSGISVECLSTVHGRSMLPHDYQPLLERLGVTRDIYDRGDWVHNYSEAKKHIKKKH